MSDFDIKDWRRDLEQSIQKGEALHIRLLLDRIEQEWDFLDGEADYWMDASHVTPAASTPEAPASTEAAAEASAG
jgi:hypothetical protein